MSTGVVVSLACAWQSESPDLSASRLLSSISLSFSHSPGKRICFKDAHFPPRHGRKFHFFSGPKVCGEFRDRMVALLGHTEGRTATGSTDGRDDAAGRRPL